MRADCPSSPHPHLARRCAAATAALGCTTVWIMIYTALWKAQVTRHWLHHAILVASGVASFALPCLAVWFLARCYDRVRTFRGL